MTFHAQRFSGLVAASLLSVAFALPAHAADPDLIQTDCLALLQDLADKAFLLTVTEPSP